LSFVSSLGVSLLSVSPVLVLSVFEASFLSISVMSESFLAASVFGLGIPGISYGSSSSNLTNFYSSIYLASSFWIPMIKFLVA